MSDHHETRSDQTIGKYRPSNSIIQFHRAVVRVLNHGPTSSSHFPSIFRSSFLIRNQRFSGDLDFAILLCFIVVFTGFLKVILSPIRVYDKNPQIIGSLVAFPPIVDLGRVDQGEEVPFAFTLVNKGHDLIEIKAVNRPCTCTRISLREGVVIAPLSNIRVDGMIRTIGKRKSFVGDIPIAYKTRNMETRSTCFVKLMIMVDPKIILSDENITLNGRDWYIEKLSHSDGVKFRVLSVEVSHPDILWKPVDPIQDGEKDTFHYKIAMIAPRNSHEKLSGFIKFVTTIEEDPEIQIPITMGVNSENDFFDSPKNR